VALQDVNGPSPLLSLEFVKLPPPLNEARANARFRKSMPIKSCTMMIFKSKEKYLAKKTGHFSRL
jgi:hypothetical protein